MIRWAAYEDAYALHEGVLEIFDEASRMHWNTAEPGTIRKRKHVVFRDRDDSDAELRAEIRLELRGQAVGVRPTAQAVEAAKRTAYTRSRKAIAARKRREMSARVRCQYCGARSVAHRCPSYPRTATGNLTRDMSRDNALR